MLCHDHSVKKPLPLRPWQNRPSIPDSWLLQVQPQGPTNLQWSHRCLPGKMRGNALGPWRDLTPHVLPFLEGTYKWKLMKISWSTCIIYSFINIDQPSNLGYTIDKAKRLDMIMIRPYPTMNMDLRICWSMIVVIQTRGVPLGDLQPTVGYTIKNDDHQ